ncbi:MAG: glycosyltransferase [Thermoanaerobaculia bacterium]
MTNASAAGAAGRDRPLRVLQVVGNITLAGGAQRQVLEVVRRLPAERFSVEVVHLQGDGGLASRFREAGAAVHDHTARAWDPIGVLRTAARLRRGRFDLVHAHLSRGEIVATAALALAGRRSGRRLPFVVHKHNEDDWWRRWPLSWVHAAVTRRAAVLVAPSRRVVAFFSDPELRVADPGCFRVVPFGRVSPEPPPREEARTAVRDTLGVGPETRVLLAAGRLVAQKRHDILLEAFARLSEGHPEARLAIAGTGELEDELRTRTGRPDLAGRVAFLGLLDDLPLWLAGCDVFVNPSDYEGLPLVVLDAMAARAPIVATAVSGVPDCVLDGETGRLVPPGDAGALAAALGEALERPEEARSWGEAARRRVEREFSMEQAAARWAALYEEVAAPAGAPA